MYGYVTNSHEDSACRNLTVYLFRLVGLVNAQIRYSQILNPLTETGAAASTTVHFGYVM
jgi:hypothetical protein